MLLFLYYVFQPLGNRNTHRIFTKTGEEVAMKHCLLCRNTMPGTAKGDPTVLYICSSCVQAIASWPPKMFEEHYIRAIEEDDDVRAYALLSFVPRQTRIEHPLKDPEKTKKRLIRNIENKKWPE